MEFEMEQEKQTVLSPEAAAHLRELLEADPGLEGEAAEYEAEMVNELQQIVEGVLSDPTRLRVYLHRVYQQLLRIHRAEQGHDSTRAVQQAWSEISVETMDLLKENVVPAIRPLLEQDARRAQERESSLADRRAESNDFPF